jgi:hypothetical protein
MKKYRALRKGEKVRRGDEVYDMSSGVWTESINWKRGCNMRYQQCPGLQYRRPIKVVRRSASANKRKRKPAKVRSASAVR